MNILNTKNLTSISIYNFFAIPLALFAVKKYSKYKLKKEIAHQKFILPLHSK
jgi:hypothetical protein